MPSLLYLHSTLLKLKQKLRQAKRRLKENLHSTLLKLKRSYIKAGLKVFAFTFYFT